MTLTHLMHCSSSDFSTSMVIILKYQCGEVVIVGLGLERLVHFPIQQ